MLTSQKRNPNNNLPFKAAPAAAAASHDAIVVAALPGVVWQVGLYKKGHVCLKLWSTPEVEILYEIYVLFTVLVVPLTIMCVAYVTICHELWNISIKRKENRCVFNCERAHFTESLHKR